MTLLKQANQALRQSRYEEAIALYVQALQSDSPVAHLVMPNLKLARQRWLKVRESTAAKMPSSLSTPSRIDTPPSQSIQGTILPNGKSETIIREQMFTPAKTAVRVVSPVPATVPLPAPSPMASTPPDPARLAETPAPQAALVVHVYHLDTLTDLSRYAANFPASADQFITCPDSFDLERVTMIAKALPHARIVQVPNAGQDVGALMALADRVDLSHYDVICKIHSKKGVKEPVRWRHALLRGVLGSTKQVKDILEAFEHDPKVIKSKIAILNVRIRISRTIIITFSHYLSRLMEFNGAIEGQVILALLSELGHNSPRLPYLQSLLDDLLVTP